MASTNHQILTTTTFFLLFFFALAFIAESSFIIHYQHNKTVGMRPQRITKHSHYKARFGSFDRREFLIEHNKIRKQLGEPPLIWDKQLTKYARRFASKRVNDCRMIHSSLEPKFGENIYWGSVYEKHTAADAVRKWAAETNFYDRKSNSCATNKDCGHYKQIAWRASTKVGCARQKCLNGGVYIICSYDPPGNWEDENPFDAPLVNQVPPQSSSQATPPPSPPATTTTTPTIVPPPPPSSSSSPSTSGNLPPFVPHLPHIPHIPHLRNLPTLPKINYPLTKSVTP